MVKTAHEISKPFAPRQLILTIILHAHRLITNATLWSNLLIVLISIFYLLNAKDGHDWGGDFSMYIMNANNIVKGSPYAQTGYVYNIDVAYYGPPAYPPVFPLMLAPFISIWGTNLQILKLPGIFCYIMTLFILNNKIIPKEMSSRYKFLFLISLGFYPFFFLQSESILSDFPFLLFSYLALYMINEQLDPSINGSKKRCNYFLTGFLIYLACGTRSVGLVLIPVAFVFAMLRNRKITMSLIIILSIPVALILAQSFLLPQTGSYFDQFQQTLSGLFSTIVHSIGIYFSEFSYLFPFKNFIITAIVFSIIFEGFVLGLIVHLKKKISSFDLFLFFYIGLLLVWPSYQGLRFLIPIIPIYFLYTIEGFEKIILSIKIPWLRKTFPLIILIGIIVYYGNFYINSYPRPITDIKRNETQELFKYIQNETNSEDVILFFKPRVMALFTQRKSVAMKIPSPTGDTLTRMKELDVSLVVFRRNYDKEFQQELDQFIKSHPDNFKLLFENPDFKVYKTIYSSSINNKKDRENAKTNAIFTTWYQAR